ncbi:MAG: ferric reductase-like transmembrane domain-containing protein [Blastocatellia bacterium]|nr:ferric reductase-like transmembrane domain-containing protein [Blastocatellia bacterium]
MSHGYVAVQWNPQKRRYDTVIAVSVAVYVAAFVAIGLVANPFATAETLLIRAFGSGAILLLHVALAIGPLCRLDARFLPLLYNRRHLGVATFLLGAAHGGFAVFQFHALGDVNPFVSLLASNTRFSSLSQFPFQQLGLAALVILFLMAATSHDFWLTTLTGPVWKRLHMLAYAAYGLLIAHVAFGTLQTDRSPLLAGALALGASVLLGLHLAAARREAAGDREAPRSDDGFVDVCHVDEIPDSRARVVTVGGERVAVYRFDGCISAISSVCQHQNGPLGEGKVLDGCITCPWHGFQYEPETGASPAPFTEKVPVFATEIREGRVYVDPRPFEPGTRVEPSRIAAVDVKGVA